MIPNIDHGALDALYEDYREDAGFEHLRLGNNRLVPGEGGNPRVFIVGEAPGAQEAEKLRPFIGQSGKLLRTLMLVAGLRAQWLGRQTSLRVVPFCREGLPPNCWITNVVKYRPVGNRTPNAAEIDLSRPYLVREWVAVCAPTIIVPVGAVAYRAVFPRATAPLTKRVGQVIRASLNPRAVSEPVRDGWHSHLTVVPMLHPSYLLRGGSKEIDRAATDWERLGRLVKERGIC